MLQFKNYLAALFTLLICLSSFAVHAQIYGEGEMSTRNYPLEDVYKVNVNFYADITIDMEAAPGITITAEENIQDYIGSKIRNGVLTFDQKKWIEPSKRIIIKVGAPDLREVYMDTHDELKVVNVTGDIFKVEAEIGTVSLSGKVDDLRIKSEQSKILAENLITRIASVDIEEDGEVVINATETVDCDIDEEGRFKNISNTATSSGCAKAENRPSVDYSNVKYIDLKIKNNSWSERSERLSK